MGVELTYLYVCSRCGKTKRDSMLCDLRSGPVAKPCAPEGWTGIEGSLYCENHLIKIEVIDLKYLEVTACK